MNKTTRVQIAEEAISMCLVLELITLGYALNSNGRLMNLGSDTVCSKL